MVGQPIGRIGNIINGDILGGPSNLPWATAYTNADAVLQPGFRLGVAYQPAGAYEALGTLVILLILIGIRRRGVRPGVVIISYVALYSVSQFLLDFLRQSEPVIWLGLRELSLTAIVSLVVLVPLMIVVWRRTEGRAGPRPEAAAVSGLRPGPDRLTVPSPPRGPSRPPKPSRPSSPNLPPIPSRRRPMQPAADAEPSTDAEEAATS